MADRRRMSLQMRKNLIMALALGLVAVGVGTSVFWWRFSHKMAPMPQGSVYGNAYLPVSSAPAVAPEGAAQPNQTGQ